MNSLFFIILIALTAAMFAWGVGSILVTALQADKRRLKQRLASDVQLESAPSIQRSIVISMQTDGLSATLSKFAMFRGMYRMLLQAYPETSLTAFLGIMIGCWFGGLLLAAMIFESLFMAFIIACGIGYIPFFALQSKRSKRQKLMTAALPEALDFLSRILRAGHSLSTGLQMMSEELPQPLAGEFRRCYEQHSLGQPLEDCLKDMATRIESTDFAFFVTAVLIQRQTGGDLSEVLNNISGMIRQRIRLQQHVKAKTAEGRFTGYVLVAFPALMFLLAYALNPKYAEPLLTTSTGLTLLGVSFGLQMLGLLAIRKITTIKV